MAQCSTRAVRELFKQDLFRAASLAGGEDEGLLANAYLNVWEFGLSFFLCKLVKLVKESRALPNSE